MEVRAMKLIGALCLGAFVTVLWLAGSTPAKADQKEDEAKIKENLAKLTPEDRKIAEEQKWCAVEDDNLLGLMGTPVKVMIKDEPVFLCCKGCVKSAKKDPDKTLAKVKELKAKAAAEKSAVEKK
jgi:hypothetical protein